ncbi:alpha,alpha-trehalase [Ranunculus cassubicifolius]
MQSYLLPGYISFETIKAQAMNEYERQHFYVNWLQQLNLNLNLNLRNGSDLTTLATTSILPDDFNACILKVISV